MSKPEFDETLADLTAEFTRSGLAEMHIRQGDFAFYLSSEAGAGAGSGAGAGASRHAPAPLSSSAVRAAVRLPGLPKPATSGQPMLPPSPPAGSKIIAAPNLGIFYRAAKPGASAYVEVVALIAEGDELCLIEVMNLFTAVRADSAGGRHAVLAEDGSMVEAGQPLFALVDI